MRARRVGRSLLAFGALLLATVVGGAKQEGAGGQGRLDVEKSSFFTYICVPAEVVVGPGNTVSTTSPGAVMVDCTESPDPNGTVLFAVSAVDPMKAARYLSLFETAKAAGRWLQLTYDSSDPGDYAIGCLPPYCRVVWQAGLE